MREKFHREKVDPGNFGFRSVTASASKARFSAQFFKKNRHETHQNKSEAGGNFKTFTERESFTLQLGEIYRDLQKQQSKVKARDM